MNLDRDRFIVKWARDGLTRGRLSSTVFAEELDALLREARGDGVRAAAEVAADYDKLSMHPYRVSDCILGKLNLRKRAPRINPDVPE